MVTRVWNELKDAKMTRFPKRPASDESCHHEKKLRLDASSTKCPAGPAQKLKVSLVPISPSHGTPQPLSVQKGSPSCNLSMNEPNLLEGSAKQVCRKRVAGRRRKPALRNRITWWLNQHGDTEQLSPVPATPANSPDMFLPTPSHPTSHPSSTGGVRRKRRSRRKTDASKTLESTKKKLYKDEDPKLSLLDTPATKVAQNLALDATEKTTGVASCTLPVHRTSPQPQTGNRILEKSSSLEE